MKPQEVFIYCHGELVVARRMLAGAPFICSYCGRRVRVAW